MPRISTHEQKESQDVVAWIFRDNTGCWAAIPRGVERDSHSSFTDCVDWARAVNANSKEDATAISGSLSKFLPLLSRFLIAGSPCLSSSKSNQWDASALANGVGHRSVEIADRQFAPTHPYAYGSAVVAKEGKRKMLLVNRHNGNFDLTIVGASGDQLDYVDVTAGFQPPTSTKLMSDNLTLHSFSVAVLVRP